MRIYKMFKLSLMDYVPPECADKFGEYFDITDNTDEATALLLNGMDMTDFEFSPYLLALGNMTAGSDGLPLEQLAQSGIPVFKGAKGTGASSIKEMAVGIIINSLRKLGRLSALCGMYNADLEQARSQALYTGSEMRGKTVSVLGMGKAGVEISNTLAFLGMNVIGFDPGMSLEAAHHLAPEVAISNDPMTLFPEADIVILCIEGIAAGPLVNAGMLGLFKPGSILINLTGAEAVDEEAILNAVDSGRISEFITDYPSAAIAGHPGITCYPGIAASTKEAALETASSISDSLLDFIKNGNIHNSLNFPDCDLGEIDEENRICISTVGIPDPMTLAAAILDGIDIEDMDGGVKDDIGYAVVSTKDPVESVPKIEGVTRIRVLTDI
ncbi:MAG: NAD(P)-dependent oxidoreductase [Eubacteriales bacterium]|nr:NAD(P)-dependent oxidoreductase [Eubacteriales bacterium]